MVGFSPCVKENLYTSPRPEDDPKAAVNSINSPQPDAACLKHEYKLMDESGPAHKKMFTVQLFLTADEVFEGSGASIKKAQQAAAAVALAGTSLAMPPEKKRKKALDAKLKMDEQKRKNAQQKSSSQLTDSVSTNGTGAEEASDQVETTGDGDALPKHKQKSVISQVHECALQMKLNVEFEVVKEVGPPHDRSYVVRCSLKNPKNEDMKMDPTYGHQINPVSRLIQVLQARCEDEPQFELISEQGQSRYKEFTVQVSCGSRICSGSGPNKRLAKRAAAEAMLAEIGYVKPLPPPGKSLLKKKIDSQLNIDDSKYPEPELAPLKADVLVEGRVKRIRRTKEAKRALSDDQKCEIREIARVSIQALQSPNMIPCAEVIMGMNFILD
ncbi:hypothetical protein TELCIR_17274 [Teladorsagia circumcincta]|uniref:DRBM domain-containing protein n=1 Tax=Teladorsagia circumcincta TaxID=45464 RepID=A0A2G9TVD9_TELCI|nr:hypothetical protein TELCIR_17274 [Teladorsagia circumcincta]